jgi:hypothetical protein
MNRWTALGVGTVLFASNWLVVALDKLPDNFPEAVSIQEYQDQYVKPTMVGTTSIYSGMLGIDPFYIFDPSQADELRPSFVSSASLR